MKASLRVQQLKKPSGLSRGASAWNASFSRREKKRAAIASASSSARTASTSIPTSRPNAKAYTATSSEWETLKRKLDSGATRAITQFFFNSDHYFRFLDKALAAGITAPIVPGIMPITNFAAIRRMSANTEIPEWMVQMFEGLDERPGPRALVAATVAAEFCRSLYEGGVRDFHFYTLNRAEQAYAICHLLGLRAKTEIPA